MTARTIEQIRTDIATLRTNEAISKQLIGTLATEVVQRIHEHDDVDTANAFVVALSEANKRMVEGFFKAFSGHRIGEGVLGKRIKPFEDKGGVKVDEYAKAKEAFDSFVESGLTIWQWAFTKREADPDAVVDMAKAAKAFHAKAKKAIKQGQSRLQILTLAIGETFTVEEVMNLLGELTKDQLSK